MHFRLRPLLLPLVLPALAAWTASSAPAAETLRAAAQAYLDEAATAGLRTAYLAHVADDATIPFLPASGRAEIERVSATKIAADAKFHAEPLIVAEAAAHDLGYVWGRYRLDFTRTATGEHLTAYGRFVDVWKNVPDHGWQLFLESWAPLAAADHTPAPAAALTPPPALSPITLRQAEAQFLDQAGREGIRAAFLAHLAPDGTIMFLNAVGRDAAETALATLPADARLTAEPAVLAESASGDLGYVCGRYTFTATVDAKPFSAGGQFITIWKREPDGAWRIVLDHGTQDPAPPPTPVSAAAASTSAKS
jgi:ketosteroid isomerase-like protein